MTLEKLKHLESLIDQLLVERSDLLAQNQELNNRCDRMTQDRDRVGVELDALLEKLDRLEGKAS